MKSHQKECKKSSSPLIKDPKSMQIAWAWHLPNLELGGGRITPLLT